MAIERTSSSNKRKLITEHEGERTRHPKKKRRRMGSCSAGREDDARALSIQLPKAATTPAAKPVAHRRPRVQPRYVKTRAIKDCLGGAVFQGIDCATQRIVIIKEVFTTNDATRTMIENEITVHGYLSSRKDLSPRIVKLLDVVRTPESVSMIIEFAEGGELFSFVQAGNGAAITKTAIAQTVEGLAHLHNAGVAHLDLTPENLMLDGEGNVKIIDFGVSHLCNDLCVERAEAKMSDEDSLKHLNQPVGKLKNMAPEVYATYSPSSSPYDGRAADVWSLGIAMFMLLFGFPPIEIPSPLMDKRCAKILNGDLAGLIAHWGLECEPEALDLMQKMLLPAQERITLDEVASHPYFG